MGADTTHMPVAGFSLSDIYAFPKPGVRVGSINGRTQPFISGSHVRWYWLKSGWIFRAGGLGYAGLNLLNGISKNDFSFAENKTKLGIAAAALLTGVLLGKLYKPTFRLGEKYHLDVFNLSK